MVQVVMFCSDLGAAHRGCSKPRTSNLFVRKFVPAGGTRLPTKPQTTISAVVILHGSSRTD
jgi:hypothetical protein